MKNITAALLASSATALVIAAGATGQDILFNIDTPIHFLDIDSNIPDIWLQTEEVEVNGQCVMNVDIWPTHLEDCSFGEVTFHD